MANAIVKRGSRQYRVTDGEKLAVDYLRGKSPGDEVKFDDVLHFSDGKEIKIGTPTVKGASVTARVVEHVRDVKIMGLKYKRAKHSQKKWGHRQRYTVVEIVKIATP